MQGKQARELEARLKELIAKAITPFFSDKINQETMGRMEATINTAIYKHLDGMGLAIIKHPQIRVKQDDENPSGVNISILNEKEFFEGIVPW